MVGQAGIPRGNPLLPSLAPSVGMVVAVYFADDMRLPPSRARQIRCDVQLVGGGFCSRIPVAQDGASVTNGSLWVPEAATGTLSGDPLRLTPQDDAPGTPLEDMNGDYVLVIFTGPLASSGIVVAALPHPGCQMPQEGAEPTPLPTYAPGEAESLQRAPSGRERWLCNQGTVARVDRVGNVRADLTSAGTANDGVTPAESSESAAVAAVGLAAASAAGVAAGATAGARAGSAGGDAVAAARAAARVVARKAARVAKRAAEIAEAAGEAVAAVEGAPSAAIAAAEALAIEEARVLAQLVTDAAEARVRDARAAASAGGASAGATAGAVAGLAVAAEVAAETQGHGVGWIDLNLKPGACVILRSGGVPVFVLTAEADGQVQLDVGRDAGERAVLGDRLMALFDAHRHLYAYGETGPVVVADRISSAQGFPALAVLSERVRLPVSDEA